MGTILKIPGWFALLLRTDRSGRHSDYRTERGTNINVPMLNSVISMLRAWQARNEMRAAVLGIDDRTLRDIGRVRADFDELLTRDAEERGVRLAKRWLG